MGEVLNSTGMPAARLVVEVTESTRLDRPDVVEGLGALNSLGVRVVHRRLRHGIRLAQRLSANPLQFVKIDRSFVAAMVSEPRAESLIHGVVELAQRLHTTIVAGGIEDAEQLARLRAMGCALGQGFYFSEPMKPAKIRKQLMAAPEQGAGVPRESGASAT